MTSVASLKKTVRQTNDRVIKVHGRAEVHFKHKDEMTSPGRIYYCDPLKVLFPRGDVPTAVLVTTGGGLFGGDIYDIDVHLQKNAHAVVTAQAAEKVYRSTGPDCEVNVNLKAEEGACLEWLPQETILFNQARFRRKTSIDLANHSSILAGEIIVFGRLASGEEVQNALVREAWEIRKDKKLIWADALHMNGDIQEQLDHVSAFGGARAIATAVFYNKNAEQFLDLAREAQDHYEGVRLGTSYVNNMLVCRWLAKDPYNLRKAFGGFWSKFRNEALGRASTLPRLWQC